MREALREIRWTKAAEKLVRLPGVSPEVVGSLLADAFQPIFIFDRGIERAAKLRQRAEARRRLREMIEERLGVSLP